MTANSYVWIGPISGSWQVAANWEDLTTGADPSTIAPGLSDDVTFNSSTNLFQVINGHGNAASLTLNGDNLINGKIDADTLAGTGSLTVIGGAALSAASGAMQGGFSVQGTDALAKIAGNFVWGYGVLDAAAGGKIKIGGTLTVTGNETSLNVESGGTLLADDLLMTGNNASAYYASVASNGIFQIGQGAAVAGELVIEAHATFAQQEGSAYLRSDVLDNGTIISDSLLECTSISGTGKLIGTSGTNPGGTGTVSAALLLGTVSGLGAITLDQGYASISSVLGVSHITIVQGRFEANLINAASAGTGITLSGGAELFVPGTVGTGVRVEMKGARDIVTLSEAGETQLNFGGTLTGFDNSDAILIDGLPISSATYTAGANGGAGMIDLFDNGNQDGSIAIAGTFKGEKFLLVTIGSGETEIVLSPAKSGTLEHDELGAFAKSNAVTSQARAVENSSDDHMPFIYEGSEVRGVLRADAASENAKVRQWGLPKSTEFAKASLFDHAASFDAMNWASATISPHSETGIVQLDPKLRVNDLIGGLSSCIGTFS